MGRSLDSSRPILGSNKRASARFSTFSDSPSLALSHVSDGTMNSNLSGDPRVTEIKEITEGLGRLESKQMQQQRFTPTQEKTENLNKLALGAKLDRALRNRMTNQDAVWRPKRRSPSVAIMTEKYENAGLNEKVAAA